MGWFAKIHRPLFGNIKSGLIKDGSSKSVAKCYLMLGEILLKTDLPLVGVVLLVKEVALLSKAWMGVAEIVVVQHSLSRKIV